MDQDPQGMGRVIILGSAQRTSRPGTLEYGFSGCDGTWLKAGLGDLGELFHLADFMNIICLLLENSISFFINLGIYSILLPFIKNKLSLGVGLLKLWVLPILVPQVPLTVIER